MINSIADQILPVVIILESSNYLLLKKMIFTFENSLNNLSNMKWGPFLLYIHLQIFWMLQCCPNITIFVPILQYCSLMSWNNHLCDTLSIHLQIFWMLRPPLCRVTRCSTNQLLPSPVQRNVRSLWLIISINNMIDLMSKPLSLDNVLYKSVAAYWIAPLTSPWRLNLCKFFLIHSPTSIYMFRYIPQHT